MSKSSPSSNPSYSSTQSSRDKSKSNGKTMREALESRASQELILAFAGPIGCGTSLVVAEAKLALELDGYEVHIIKLSTIIEQALEKRMIELSSDDYKKYSPKIGRIIKLQDGGNKLREKSSSYLSEHAIQEIVVQRGKQKIRIEGPENGSDLEKELLNYVPIRTAYLIDQVKHPDEVSILRIVYRKLFHLIGVISVAEKRRERLLNTDRANMSEISEVMERDRRQEADNGQQLDKTLKLADFYISTDAGTTTSLQRKLKRFIGLLHGENGITPTIQEYGMYAAYAAGLKSACLSRQVGAAIADKSGKIISTGCNDVPKANGGLYSTEDGANDRRCVHREEQMCFNDREKHSHKADIRRALEGLKKEGEDNTPLIQESRLDEVLETVFKASRIDDLTEFSRAVHAEMDAIISLARTGTQGIAGSNLFTTTFPCHSCARHILAAGIKKVYYIEPYEKSLAKRLHSDAIEFETEDDESGKVVHNGEPLGSLVRFIHFEGVAPRQYLNFFQMTERKNKGNGTVIKIMTQNAPKVVSEYLDNYRNFEAKVLEKLNKSDSAQSVPTLKEVASQKPEEDT